jgi:hypothetical protein
MPNAEQGARRYERRLRAEVRCQASDVRAIGLGYLTILIDPVVQISRNQGMQTNRTILVTTAVCLMMAAAVFAQSPHLGTWKYNASKSKAAEGAGHNDTVTYTEGKDGMMKVTVDGVDKDGKAVHWTWEGKFDGKPYKVEGSPEMDTITYKKVNDHTNHLTGKKGDEVVMTGAITVAKDGKSRTVKTTTTDPSGKKTTSESHYDKE